MTTAIAGVIDASVVAALGLVACRLLRRRSASLRHLIVAASLAAAAITPILEATVPRWEIAVLSSSVPVTTSSSSLGSALSPLADSARVDTPETPALTWTTTLVAIWGIGFLVVMAGLVAGLFRLVTMTRRCRPVQSAAWREHADALSKEHGLTRPTVVLESPDRALLLTWGLFRPRIIVPAGAGSWTAERIEVVLAHECAHIARRDWTLQIAAETLRAAYWFNPLIWIACRRLRDESEQCCDDAVLRRGIDAADYASHLLAVARHVITVDRGWASAPAVANASTLERRISGMLTPSRNRESLTVLGRACTVLAAFTVAVPLAAMTLTEHVAAATIAPAVLHDVELVAPAAMPAPADLPVVAPKAARPVPRAVPRAAAAPAQQPIPINEPKPIYTAATMRAKVQGAVNSATLSGVLRDASGAVLPGVMVTLADTAAGMKYSTVTDATGSFAFKSLPPARYEFTARLPGFATLTEVVTLGSGEDLQRRLEMKVGSLAETISVVCPVGGAARAPRASAVFAFDGRPAPTRLFAQQALPVRIGGQIAAPRQIKTAQPLCPGMAPDAGLVVILESTIGVDGLIREIKILRPGQEQQQAFVQSAIAAVRQWEYTPTRLNNVPIPVTMTVTVMYRRQ